MSYPDGTPRKGDHVRIERGKEAHEGEWQNNSTFGYLSNVVGIHWEGLTGTGVGGGWTVRILDRAPIELPQRWGVYAFESDDLHREAFYILNEAGWKVLYNHPRQVDYGLRGAEWLSRNDMRHQIRLREGRGLFPLMYNPEESYEA
jgi:hypothetical protein